MSIKEFQSAQAERGVDSSGTAAQVSLTNSVYELAERALREALALPSLTIEEESSTGATKTVAHPLVKQANELAKTAQAGIKALGLNADSKNAARAEEDGLGKFMASLEE